MRAFLAVGDEPVRRRPHQDADLALPGVVEDLRAADRELVLRRDFRLRGPRVGAAPQAEQDDPELAHDECEAGQAEELREVPARPEIVAWPVDRKLLAPERLLGI